MRKGDQIVIFTNSDHNTVTVAHDYPAGTKVIVVEPFHPTRQYRKGTIIINPSDLSNAGSTNHYIDQMAIPLDLESPIEITARERRVGSKKDAIRIGEYSTGFQ